MKISINTDSSVTDTQIEITCNRLTPQVDKILSMLRMLDMQLTGTREGEQFLIQTDKVLYIETVDKKTFLYTNEEVYESNLKLYELEERLLEAGFFRASKSCIINFEHITSLKADLDRRICVRMDNGERLIVSRQYADSLKERLGAR